MRTAANARGPVSRRGSAPLTRPPRAASKSAPGRAAALAGLLLVGMAGSAAAATFTVNSTADGVDANPGDGVALTAAGTTTLRAAIMEANALAGPDLIILPAGTYTLTLAGPGEDAAVTGDLDVNGELSITGAGASSTTIDANGLDRVFDVRLSSVFAISGVTIRGGNPGAGQGGGGILVGGSASATLTDCVVTGNSGGLGGGVNSAGALQLVQVRVTANTATDQGGGVYGSGSSSVVRSCLDGNSAGNIGGGFRLQGAGATATLTNVTVSGNSAANFGGGIALAANATGMTLQSVTVAANAAVADGGGIFRPTGAVFYQILNTLVAGNSAPTGPDASGSMTSLGNNLVGNTAGSSGWVASDLQNVAAQIGPLANNGGTTPTHALLAGSPALNAGSATGAPATDQRGVPRPQGAGFDIGAYEAQTLSIGGAVFEDLNYGGGAGRSLAVSSGVARPTGRVELFDGSGNFVSATATDAGGNYAFNGLLPGNYLVRVVSSSVTSSRTGYVAGLLPVMTYRTDASSGTANPVTDFVGGLDPATADAGNAAAGWVLNAGTGLFSGGGAGKAHAFSPVTLTASNVGGVDFGWCFDVVVNRNAGGQGSLSRAVANANTLGGDAALAQAGRASGIENLVFMLGNGTSAAGLRSSVDQFVAGIATIQPGASLTLSTPMIVDAQTQPGWAGAPLLELDGTGTGAGVSGFTMSAGGSTVRGFIINRWGDYGISVTGPGNTIQGNWVGLASTGTSGAANGTAGIAVNASNTLVGGALSAQRNVVSGNSLGVQRGVYVFNGGGGTVISGNYLGTNAAGTAALPGQSNGVMLSAATGVMVGGTAPGAGNLISGSSSAGAYVTSGSTGVRFQGNRFGLDAAGTGTIPNPWAIYVEGGATVDTIGGVVAGAGNVVTGSTSGGIAIDRQAGAANKIAILGNSVYGNAGLGIDLSANGVTLNDGNTSANQPNILMDSPVFTGATLQGTQLNVTGYVGSAPGQSLFAGVRVEVFVSDNDPSGYGEGRTLIGSLTTDASGDFAGALDATGSGLGAGSAVTGTATDAAGNTSEFGANFTVVTPSLSGTVFEDVDYGGGAGRSLAASGGVARSGARVELYDGAGAFAAFTTTDGLGNYSFNGLASGSYTVRVVSGSVTSSRPGAVAGLLAVQTYRTDAGTGAPIAVTDRVGGEVPSKSDAGNGATTLAALTTAVTTAQSVTAVSLGASGTSGVDFGFCFDVIVNVNDSGQGSLRQWITNANALGNAGLAQAGRPAGIESAIWMISNGTSAPGLRAANNYLSSGVATLSPASSLPIVTDPVLLDATTQPGFGGTPIVEINGAGAGAGTDGLDVSAGGTTIQGLVINRFGGNGLHLHTSGGNTIRGNLIGLDAAGSVALGNGADGVSLDGISNNVVGGTAPGQRNVVSANLGNGVSIRAGGANNLVAGNLIGTDVTGTAGLGNSLHGVRITDGSNNTVGGIAAGAGNRIVANALAGVAVLVTTGTATGNAIEGNAILANAGLGIDLGANGVTANDGATTAGQPNLLMDFPVLTTATLSGGNLTLAGYVGTAPGQAVFAGARVEFFKANPDPLGYGEGETYLGFLTADAGGNFLGTLAVSGLSVGDRVTATATDGSDNTSEFGANVVTSSAGITVNPTAGLITTESGGAATFTVALDSPPTANVVIGLTSSDLTEGTVAPAALTFTPASWNVPQTVTVTGVDDSIQDGTIAYTIVTAPATSTDPNYNGLDPSDVSVSNTDNDTAGITVSPTAGLTTSESGGTATFTVRLDSQPTANVVIGLTSSDLTEGTVAPAALTFTSANWNAPQTVTVTGVDDAIPDGTIAYTIVTAPAASTDPNYSGLDPADVSVSNLDNDLGQVATFTASPAVVLADGVAASVLTVTLRTLGGAPIPGKTITFGSDRGASDAIQQPAGPTDVNGAATGAVRSTVAGAATLTATDVSDTLTIATHPQVAFTRGAVLQLDLSAARRVVNLGQPVPYTLAVRNRGVRAVASFRIEATLPRDFRYLPGSARWNGQPIPDPPRGLVMSFAVDSLAGFVDANGDGLAGPGESGYAELAFTLVPGAGAEPGSYDATAVARDACPACAISNVASAEVQVEESGLLSEGTILGQVFEDRNRDGVQERGEPGIGATEVVLDDGSRITTDREGRFHVPAVTPGERVLKLDAASLPTAGVLTTDEALPVTVRPGLLARAQFGVWFGRDTVRIGSPPVPGLAMTVDSTEDVLDLVGNINRPALLVNGHPVRLRTCDARITADGLDEIVRLDGDRLQAPVQFLLDSEGAGDVTGYTLNVVDAAGDTVRRISGRGTPPARLSWDGTLERGGMLRGGEVYPYQLTVEFADGGIATSARRTLGVERHTSIALTMTGDAFGPSQVALSERAKRALDRLAETMRKSPGEQVVVEGHTDSMGTESENLLLSRRRAEAAVRYLVEKRGIPRSRLVVTAYGESRPVASNAFPEGRELNRRIEIHGQASELTRARLLDYLRSMPVVTVAARNVPVDADGRFALRVPRSSAEPLDVRLVDRQGRTASTRIEVPRLEILVPPGEVRAPFSGQSGDLRAGPKAALTVKSGVALAGFDPLTAPGVVGSFHLRGTTDVGVQIEVDGAPLAVGGDGSFATDLALRVGENTFGVLARDARGGVNVANVRVRVASHEADGREVQVQPGVPAMTVILPPPNVPLRGNRLAVSGSTAPENRVTVNGDSVRVAADGTFGTTVTLPEGRRTLQVGVRDPSGAVGSVERDLDVRAPKTFAVAVAEGIVGSRGSSSFLRTTPAGAGDTWNEARLAYYLRGTVAGRYRLTSGFDTGRRSFGSLFRGSDDASQDRLLRQLDPDRIYPMYGDSSTVAYETESAGRFHMALDGEALQARVGNFPISLQQSELTGFQRTLYGAQVNYRSPDRGAQPGGTRVTVLGAEARYTPVRDVLSGTGGSLYYLSQSEIVEGSDQVAIVIRDRITGLPLLRLPQVRGRDYEIKCLEGRLLFARPVPSVWDDGALLNGSPLRGQPVSIEVDVETRGDRLANGAVGGRIHQQVGSRLGLGTTYLEDRTGGQPYRLGGTDAELRLGSRSRLVGEIARSQGFGARTFSSQDGGIAFAASDTTDGREGVAWKAAAELDPGEWFGAPGRAQMGGYVKRVEPGFEASGSAGPAGRDLFGWSGGADLRTWGRWSARFDRETRTDSLSALRGAVHGSDRLALGWQRDARRWGMAAEFQATSWTMVDSSSSRAGVGALRLWRQLRPGWTTTLDRQQTLSGPGADLTTLGTRMQLPGGLEFDGAGSSGAGGRALRAGLGATLGGRRLYARDEWADRHDGPVRGTVVGMESPLGRTGRAYSEYQWQRTAGGDGERSLVGLEQGWRHASGASLRMSGEWSTTGHTVGSAKRGALASELAYAGRLPLSGSTRTEWRIDGADGEDRQFVSATRLQANLAAGFSLRGDFRTSTTRRVGATARLRYQETGIGLAYRSSPGDRLQGLARYTWLSDRRPTDPTELLTHGTLLGVAALEATARVGPGVEWSGKYARSMLRDGPAAGFVPSSHTDLWIHRVHLAVVHPLGFASEYRLLRQSEAGNARGGFLEEATWELAPRVRLGGGYNFTRITDNEFAQGRETDHGWFVRAQARY